MAGEFLRTWLEGHATGELPKNITVLKERQGQRHIARSALREAIQDHFVGLEIIASIGGFPKAAKIIRNALPTGKITRSGDFGEILATEYIDQCTGFAVPIRRLRYKDDRSVAMRGDDVLAFNITVEPTRILKTEAKSRVRLTQQVVEQAGDGLRRHHGRPNPSTLSFVSRRLRELGKHDFAEAVEYLQEANIQLASIEHLIFTVSGNNPASILKSCSRSPIPKIRRHLTGCVVRDHAEFIKAVFESASTGATADGNG